MSGASSVSGARDALRQRLCDALGSGSFGYQYQPIVVLPGGQLWGVEALLRWNDEGRWRPAADFVAVAGSLGILPAITYGTLVDLGIRTLSEVLEVLGPEGVLCLNLSPAELADEAIQGLLLDGPLGAVAESIMLELPPTSPRVLRGLDSQLQSLRSVGFRIALDNSGRSWPGREMLARMDPEVVKVDTRSLHPGHLAPGSLRGVARMHTTLRSMVADACHAAPIASGVSSQELEIRALNSGVGLGQGVHLAPPMILVDLRDWVRAASGAR